MQENKKLTLLFPDWLSNTWLSEEARENTPGRVNRYFDELKSREDFTFTTFANEGYDQIIILKDCEFASTCEHHLLPFHGSAHVGYIPKKHICGISKLARVVDKFAARPQLQERLTQQIVDFLAKELKPKGVMVVIEAAHDCMRIRGVKKQHSVMVTSALMGVFRTKPAAREEFLMLINRP